MTNTVPCFHEADDYWDDLQRSLVPLGRDSGPLMAFSGALTLTDLNDFITPSQACIKPVEQLNKQEANDPSAAATEIQIDQTGNYVEVSNSSSGARATAQPKKLEKAEINLNDCLACSGCITSAESVLITLQSHIEVLDFLEKNAAKARTSSNGGPGTEPYRIPIISISPQTLASLAAATAARTTESSLPSGSSSPPSAPPTSRQIFRRARAFCTQILGFDAVFDTTFARHLSLREHIAEFEERRERFKAVGNDKKEDLSLPMLASACPGWICYAEKAHAEMLPFISTTKSPQQVMGTLVKNWMGERWGKRPDEIYHVTVMPCYDKKLEASRTDFYNELYATRDIDCVITTGELELLMKEKEWDISQPVPGELNEIEASLPLSNGTDISSAIIPELLVHPGTSSGSYLHAIMAHIQDTSPVPLTLTVATLRTSDFEEFVLAKPSSVPEGKEDVVFKGAKCYGFRNLQNVVRRVGREKGLRTTTGAAGRMGGRAAGAGAARRLAARRRGDGNAEEERGYDYVEVMACPGGCVNGGGQLKPVLSATQGVNGPVPLMGDEGKDKEGFKRDWEASGVPSPPALKSSTIDVLQNARWGSREWTKKVEEEYWKVGTEAESTQRADDLAAQIYEELCSGEDGSEKRSKLLRTQYKAVESEVIGLNVVW